MTLKEKINLDLKAAIKAKDEVRLTVLRMVKSAVTNKEIADKIASLDDSQVTSVLSTLAKRANESIEQFENGGRADLADKEKAELKVIKSYLPEALSEAELLKLVDEAAKEAGAAGPKDMGKVMKVLMPKVAGKADGKLVSALVQKRLAVKS